MNPMFSEMFQFQNWLTSRIERGKIEAKIDIWIGESKKLYSFQNCYLDI